MPSQRFSDWEAFLGALPGAPSLVVCDDDPAIHRAVTSVWPVAYVKLCEHHLQAGAIRAMKLYGTRYYGSPHMVLLNDAFHTPAGWEAFKAAATGVVVVQWVETYDHAIRDRVARRDQLPAHHSIASSTRCSPRSKSSWSPERSATGTQSAPPDSLTSSGYASTATTTRPPTPPPSEPTSTPSAAGSPGNASSRTPEGSRPCADPTRFFRLS